MCGQAGLDLPLLGDEARDGINGILKGFGWAANPVDVTGFANSESFPQIMEHMINDSRMGTLVVASAGRAWPFNCLIFQSIFRTSSASWKPLIIFQLRRCTIVRGGSGSDVGLLDARSPAGPPAFLASLFAAPSLVSLVLLARHRR
jgi:hypothetical protein